MLQQITCALNSMRKIATRLIKIYDIYTSIIWWLDLSKEYFFTSSLFHSYVQVLYINIEDDISLTCQ